MEPCLFRHGKYVAGEERTIVVEASMEPCLFRHGKGVADGILKEQIKLQWSHVFSDMVSSTTRTKLRSTEQLQWSHVFSDMVR